MWNPIKIACDLIPERQHLLFIHSLCCQQVLNSSESLTTRRFPTRILLLKKWPTSPSKGRLLFVRKSPLQHHQCWNTNQSASGSHTHTSVNKDLTNTHTVRSLHIWPMYRTRALTDPWQRSCSLLLFLWEAQNQTQTHSPLSCGEKSRARRPRSARFQCFLRPNLHTVLCVSREECGRRGTGQCHQPTQVLSDAVFPLWLWESILMNYREGQSWEGYSWNSAAS